VGMLGHMGRPLRRGRETVRLTSTQQPTQGLSRQGIAAAALELADDLGIEKLTIRKVAERLGVAPMSLYSHVASKADLMTAMLYEAFTKTRLEDVPEAPWDDRLVGFLLEMRRVLRTHPSVFSLMYTKGLTAPALLAIREGIMQALLDGGYDVEDAALLLRTIGSFTVGYFFLDHFGFYSQEPPAAELVAHYPALRRLFQEAEPIHGDEGFLRGLSLVLPRQGSKAASGRRGGGRPIA
jgi:TetR/AcrR family transcriptional regulator, tetracycline repressor protein